MAVSLRVPLHMVLPGWDGRCVSLRFSHCEAVIPCGVDKAFGATAPGQRWSKPTRSTPPIGSERRAPFMSTGPSSPMPFMPVVSPPLWPHQWKKMLQEAWTGSRVATCIPWTPRLDKTNLILFGATAVACHGICLAQGDLVQHTQGTLRLLNEDGQQHDGKHSE